MEIIRYHGLVLQTLLLICSMAIPAGVAADPVSIADASGRAVELAHPARRIVSLAPHVSELLFEIGANDLLIGAVEFSDYPPAAVEILRIGDYKNFDMESLLELKPDLVIGWWSGNRSQHIEQIRALGIPVYLSEPRRLDQIPTLMRDLGRLSGRRMQSDAVAERFERHLNRLRSQYADQKTGFGLLPGLGSTADDLEWRAFGERCNRYLWRDQRLCPSQPACADSYG